MVGSGSGVVMLRVARRNRLWVEVLRVDEVLVLGADVDGRGDNLFRRKDEVKLREPIQRLDLGFIAREWQRPAGFLLKKELQRGVHIDALAKQRSTHDASGRFIADSTQVIAADAEIRERIIQLGVPLFAAAPRLHRYHTSRETPVLRHKGCMEDVDTLNAVHRDGLRKLARG